MAGFSGSWPPIFDVNGWVSFHWKRGRHIYPPSIQKPSNSVVKIPQLNAILGPHPVWDVHPKNGWSYFFSGQAISKMEDESGYHPVLESCTWVAIRNPRNGYELTQILLVRPYMLASRYEELRKYPWQFPLYNHRAWAPKTCVFPLWFCKDNCLQNHILTSIDEGHKIIMEDRWKTQKMDGLCGQNGPKLRQFREILQPNLDNWLVVWNIWIIFPYIGNNHPNWLIFFKGVQTTNQISLGMIRRCLGRWHQWRGKLIIEKLLFWGRFSLKQTMIAKQVRRLQRRKRAHGWRSIERKDAWWTSRSSRIGCWPKELHMKKSFGITLDRQEKMETQLFGIMEVLNKSGVKFNNVSKDMPAAIWLQMSFTVLRRVPVNTQL